jgi:hypothetical protein
VTAAPTIPVPVRPVREPLPLESAGRLLRLELRRNVLPLMLPLVAVLFWIITYRKTMALPPLWNVRAMTMQSTLVAVFVPSVIGAAAWMGSREGRHGMTDLVVGTARPRWARQLAAWAATTCWAMAAYLACVGVLYGGTARQATGGGPLWWPVAVGAACLPALAALGFAAGALRPSRFTTPLVAVGAFLALEISLQMIHGSESAMQISPLVAGPWELGTTDQGVATFYPYLRDLPIAQMLFLAGLTAVFLGVLGLPAGAGGRALRRSAAAIALAGLLLAGTAVGLAGTGRLDQHGLIAIPALHNAASDRPIRYTPVCGGGAIPVCLNPAYAVYLPAVSAALEPVLGELAGLPGAPVRVSQAATTYRQLEGNGVEIRRAGPAISGSPPEFHLLLPIQLAGPTLTSSELAAAVRADSARDLVGNVVAGREPTRAQQAVMAALLKDFSSVSGDAAAAARRFAALPAAARHAWLVEHLTALRAGQITLAQLP